MQHLRGKRRWWHVLGRSRHICGPSWPRIKALTEEARQREERCTRTAVIDPAPTVVARAGPSGPTWNSQTMPFFQVARAGALTPAQERRARGGSSC
jgi:hypothetical protein